MAKGRPKGEVDRGETGMTYYCKRCKNFVQDTELLGTGENFRGREHGCCPNCHSEDLYEARKCDICGNDIPPDEQFCDDCKQDMHSAWSTAVAQMLKWHKKPKTEFESIEKLMFEFLEYEVM